MAMLQAKLRTQITQFELNSYDLGGGYTVVWHGALAAALCLLGSRLHGGTPSVILVKAGSKEIKGRTYRDTSD